MVTPDSSTQRSVVLQKVPDFQKSPEPPLLCESKETLSIEILPFEWAEEQSEIADLNPTGLLQLKAYFSKCSFVRLKVNRSKYSRNDSASSFNILMSPLKPSSSNSISGSPLIFLKGYSGVVCLTSLISWNVGYSSCFGSMRLIFVFSMSFWISQNT